MNGPQNRKYHIEAASKKEKAFLDKIIYAIGILFPLLTIPQIIEIWSNQSAADISLFTWAGYWFLSFLYTLWVIADGIKPLIVSQILWQFIYVLMIFSIINFS